MPKKIAAVLFASAALAGGLAPSAGAAGPEIPTTPAGIQDAYCDALEKAGVVFVQDCRTLGGG